MTLEEELCNTIETVKNMRLEDRPSLVKPLANKATKTMISQVNEALQKLVSDSVSLTELNQVTYAAGLYCTQKMYPSKNMSCRNEKPRALQRTPGWKLKLQRQINLCRKELSQIKQHLRAPRDQGKLKKNIDKMRKKYNIRDNDQLSNIARDLQGKIPALAKRIKNKE